MKLHTLSDIHNEHGKFNIPFIERDVLIIAGDYNYAMNGVEEIKAHAKHSPVILVLGNHDFYGHSIQEVIDFWNNIEIENFYFLNNSSVVINNIEFIGTTLFPSFNKENPITINVCRDAISDYKGQIFRDKTKQSKFSPTEAAYLGKIDKEYLKGKLSNENNMKQIVISHYLPTYESVHPRYQGGDFNYHLSGAFVSDCEDIINYTPPALWIHGHTHDSFNYKLGECQIVCNPRGYESINAINTEFDEKLLIEIEP